tara:strand:- start:868 stop:2730 length:1863 start_codon:yes stop_codon:yes gene_type:complete
MTDLIDKFAILSNTRFDSDIKKKKYIENYLNDNYICHHDLVKNQNLSIDEINYLLKNHLRKHKTVFSRMIRFGKINIDNIINFVNETKIKFNFIKSICDNEFPDEDELITNIILSNRSIDKLISSYIKDKKSIKNFLITFDKFNKDKECKEELNLKISSFIVENLPNKNLEMLWELDNYINYYIVMNKKYNYLPNQVFNESIDIIKTYVCNCIIKEKVNFLKYLQINYTKFDNILKYIHDDGYGFKNFQESLLFFRPNNFSELYDFMNVLIIMKISNKDTIIDSFIEVNKNLINEENIKFITNKININILHNISNENNYQFIKNIKFNQDLIIANITVSLMKRYIYFEEFDNSYENKEYEIMKKILPKNILYKYMKIINDINCKINYKFRFMSPIVITKPIWHFDYSKGYDEYIYEFNTHFSSHSETHYVQFFFHLGEIVTEFKTNAGTYNIRMLPIHYEIINKPNTFQYEFKNYKKEYLNFIFQQLLENEILELTNKTSGGKFQINKDYNGGDLDLIKLSNETSNAEDIEEVIRKEVSLERKEIIMANINSFLKTRDVCAHVSLNKLYGEVNKNLSIYFDIDKEYFKNIIEEMKNKEYIDVCDIDLPGECSLMIKKLIY